MLGLDLASGERLVSRIARRADHLIPDAGHRLREDHDPMVGELIAGREAHPAPWGDHTSTWVLGAPRASISGESPRRSIVGTALERIWWVQATL
jgi:hypothetical protein